MRGDPLRPIFHLLALGRMGLALGRIGVALGPREFLVTNVLVKATQNCLVGGLDQRLEIGFMLQWNISFTQSPNSQSQMT